MDGRFEVGGEALAEAAPFVLQPIRSGLVRGRLSSPLGEGFPWDVASDVRLIGVEERLAVVQASGDFEIDGLPPGFYTLRVVVDAHAPRSEPVRVGGGEVDLGVLSLDPNLSDAEWLRGRATRGGSDRHDGIVVRARIADSLFLVDTTLTDTDGVFTMPLSRSPFNVEAAAQGYRTTTVQTIWSDANTRFEVDHDNDVNTAPIALADHTIVLEPDASVAVTGQLRSPRADVQWTADAEVRLYGNNVYFGVVQPGGGFQVSGLTPGPYLLVVDVAGHETWSDSVTLTAGANTIPPIDLELEKVALVGKVLLAEQTDDNGHGGVSVVMQRDEFVSAVTISSQMGTFTAEIPSTRHTIVLALNGYVSRQVAVLWDSVLREFMFDHDNDDRTPVVPLNGTPIVLEVDRTVSATGELRSPLPNVQWSVDASVTLAGLDTFSAIVSPDGHFSTTDIRPGEYTLTIRAAGHRTAIRTVRLVSGPNDLGTFELEPDEVTARGIVMLEGETDQGLAVIRARRDGVIVATTESGAGGDFVLQITRSTHQLSISKPGFVSETVTILWDTVDERFEFEGFALEERPILLQRAADGDRDNDGVLDVVDNCLLTANASQRDIDADGLGDVCDDDIDDDGFVNGFDNCPISANTMQEDPAGDGRGVACTGIDADAPLHLPAGVSRQHLDTRARTHVLRGSCGGANTPELVYALDLIVGQRVRVSVDAEFSAVLYLIARNELADPTDDAEVICAPSTALDTAAPASGGYLLVVDGLLGGDLSAGSVVVDITPDGALYFGNRTVPTTELPIAVDVGDFDEDGFPDVVTAHTEPPALTVQLGGPDGFEAPLTFALPSAPVDVIAADLNGDGHVDLAATTSGQDPTLQSGALHLLLGDGAGGFSPTPSFPSGSRPTGMLAVDANADGATDVLSVGRYSLIMATARPDGALRGAVPFSAGVADLTTADLDGDGMPELIGGSANTLRIRRGLGDGRFGEEEVYDSPTAILAVLAADLDGDGTDDVVVTGDILPRWPYETTNTGTAIYLTRPDGTLDAPVLYHTPGRALHVSDLDGDGITDLTVIGRHVEFNARNTSMSAQISVLPGRGDGTFKDMVIHVPSQATSMTQTHDFDHDGQSEIVEVHRDGTDYTAEVHRWSGDGRFTSTPLPFQPAYTLSNLAFEDVDGDGLDDLIGFGKSNGVSVIYVFRSIADGAFAPPERVFSAADVVFVRVGDINGDGRPDLVTTDARVGSYAIVVYLANADGTYGDAVVTPLPGNPYKLQVADIDGDGLDDAIAYVTTVNQFQVHSGSASGALINATAPTGISNLYDFQVLDLDGDGWLDLVTVVASTDRVIVNYGQEPVGEPAVRFEAAVVMVIGDEPQQFFAVDLDDDNDLDLAVRDSRGRAVSVLRNDGARTFVHTLVSMPASSLTDLVVTDVDGDGKLDLAGAAGAVTTVAFGLGDATFEAGVTTDFGLGRQSDCVADLDGDGLAEVVMFHSSGGVHIGWGLGRSFRSGVGTTYTAPRFRVADIDHDGIQDYVVALSSSSNTSIIIHASSSADPWLPATVANIASGSTDFDIADFNGDGEPDFAVALSNDRSVAILPWLAPALYDNNLTTSLDAIPRTITVANLDGDGDQDLIVTLSDATGFALTNDGSGVFTRSAPVHVPQGVTGVRATDLDDDGRLDLLVASVDGGGLLFGDGAFVEPTFLRRDNAFFTNVIAADLNADDAPDVVAIDGANVYTLLGDPTAGLREAPVLTFTKQVTAVAAADLDDDGADDLLTAFFDGTLSVHRGNGDGTFTTSHSLPVLPIMPYSNRSTLAVTDIDGDGRLDALVPSENSNKVGVALDIGGTPTTDLVSVNGNALDIAVADFNRDGAVDAIVPGGEVAAINLLLNQYVAPRIAGSHLDDRGALPCVELSLDGVADGPDWTFTAPADPACRITRLELDLPWLAAPAEPLVELIAEDATSRFNAAILVDATAPLAAPGRWSPDAVNGLARFEGTLAGGTWRLRSNLSCPDGTCLPRLVVNRAVHDPLLNPDCAADLSPELAEDACVWDGAPLTIHLEADTETLLFLAVGPDGAAGFGRNLQVLATSPEDILLELLPLGARNALATGTTPGDGTWSVDLDVPLAYNDRYFAVRVLAPFGPVDVGLEAP